MSLPKGEPVRCVGHNPSSFCITFEWVSDWLPRGTEVPHEDLAPKEVTVVSLAELHRTTCVLVRPGLACRPASSAIPFPLNRD